MVTDTERILNHYIHKNRRQFLLDLFAVLPYDILALALGPRYIAILRIPKLLHVSKAEQYINHTMSILYSWGLVPSFEISRIAFMYIALFQLCHWVGCVWILIGESSTKVFHEAISWITYDKVQYHHSMLPCHHFLLPYN